MSQFLKSLSCSICILFLLGILGCSDRNAFYKKNYNVTLVADLSNRILQTVHPKPVNDTILISAFLEQIPNYLNIGNRHAGQLDIYKIDFVNKGIFDNGTVDANKLLIDFSYFENDQVKRSEYIRNEKLNSDIATIEKEVQTSYNYASVNLSGADIWNFFNESIFSLKKISESNPVITAEKDTIYRDNKNVIILFTDGYIENVNNATGYTLNSSLVSLIRTEFVKSGETDLTSFIKSNSSFQLKRTEKSLEGYSIMVNEIDDRSKDKNGVAMFHPTDFEIIKIIWLKWLEDSGAKKVEIYPEVHSKSDFLLHVSNFLNSM